MQQPNVDLCLLEAATTDSCALLNMAGDVTPEVWVLRMQVPTDVTLGSCITSLNTYRSCGHLSGAEAVQVKSHDAIASTLRL